MQIHELTQASSVNSTDVFAIDTGSITYKIPASVLVEALKSIGSLVTGVKGNSESVYRTGNINITPQNIGALPAANAVTGIKGNEESSYRNGNVNITPANIGAQPANTAVTGVKGNAETNYRTGNVNLTPQNVGALSLGGGDGNQMRGPVSRYTGADYDTPPETTSTYDAMRVLDEGDHARHRFYSSRETNGNYFLYLMTRNADQSKYNQLGVGLDQSGEPVYAVTNAAAFRRAIGAPALSDVVLASGVKQFGSLSAGSQTSDTINLSPALSTSNYIVLTECISSNIVAGVQNKTSSSFVLYVRNVSGGAATGTVSWAVIALP